MSFSGCGARIFWLMRALTNGVSTGGSLALAYKLLSWADKQPISLPLDTSWRFDALSCLIGLLTGVALVLIVEAWITVRLAFHTWLQQVFQACTTAPKPAPRPYKLY